MIYKSPFLVYQESLDKCVSYVSIKWTHIFKINQQDSFCRFILRDKALDWLPQSLIAEAWEGLSIFLEEKMCCSQKLNNLQMDPTV